MRIDDPNDPDRGFNSKIFFSSSCFAIRSRNFAALCVLTFLIPFDSSLDQRYPDPLGRFLTSELLLFGSLSFGSFEKLCFADCISVVVVAVSL